MHIDCFVEIKEYSRSVLQKLFSYTILIFRQVAILQKKIGGKLFIFQQE
jgi:hypothetical protein